MDAKVFGKKIQDIRKQHKYSLRKVEQRSGISFAYISKLENGERNVPKPETLKKLAKGIGISEDDMFRLAGLETSKDDNNKVLSINEKNQNKDSVDLDDLSTVMTFQGEPIPEKYKEIVRDLLRNLKDKEENEK